MKIICKDCGKPFHLSHGEIDFYLSKGLVIPKRCKACRQLAKGNKVDTTEKTKLVAILAVIAIVFTVFISRIIPSDNNSFNHNNNQNYSSGYCFRSDDLLQEHYAKHGIEMGFDSADEYMSAANNVINSSEALTTTQDDMDTAYFIKRTGEFVVLSDDNYIRTYFIPDNGMEYFNNQ